MKKSFFIISAHILFCINSFAQNNFDVRLIPISLLKNADVIKRYEEVFIDIKDIDKATITTKYAITILNEAGENEATFSEGYSKLISIKSLDGSLYNAEGKKIKSLKNADVSDLSGTSDGTMADDSRVKVHNFNYKIYPYTVEYECSIKLNGIFYLPAWQPVNGGNVAVEKSTLKVQTPLDYMLRYKTFNYGKDPGVTTEKDSKVFVWSVEKINALVREQYAPVLYEVTTAVFLAPTNFEIQGYKGSMTDWNGFGKFFYALNKDRDLLPNVVKEKVHTLINGVNSDKEKIKILYNYLQKNTRYVSIQLGIGGWQTFDAKYVSEKSYGDCKALSNYMYALLKEAGIKSLCTLIKAGENSTYFINDFAANQFNHMILCVPNKNDTIWLECTSQTLSAGYLSGFTANRPALLIDENGGTLVHTPLYTKDDNLQIRNIQATISEEGNLSTIVTTKFTALQQDNLHGMINALSKQKTEEYLKEIINLPSYDVVKFDYNEEKGTLPSIIEKLELTAPNYSTINGKRLFISPNIFNKNSSKIKNAAERKYDIILPIGYTDIDSVTFDMPKGYIAESVPDPILLDSKFGKYTATLKVNGSKIYYVRYNQRNGGHYPASDAKLLSDYFDKIYKADRVKVVLVKE